jgi:manganese oxidase
VRFLLFVSITLVAMIGGTLSAALSVPELPPPLPGSAPSYECPAGVPLRVFDVVAIKIPISYNHWGDVDPEGRLFVLKAELPTLLAQVAANLEKAGLETIETLDEDAVVTLETQLGDVDFVRGLRRVNNLASPEPFDVSALAQPLIVRAHIGDCVEFRLESRLAEPVSIHIHRAQGRPGDGMALGPASDDLTLPGQVRTYRYFIPDLAAMEGAHFFHSHADARYQTKHGLFGALVAEPKHSHWLTPDGYPSMSGADAVIVRPDPSGLEPSFHDHGAGAIHVHNRGPSDFREHVLIYHDEIELLDKSLRPLPIVSPYGEYGPGSKGINLRTEPFFDRFDYHDDQHELYGADRGHDKSQGYGSYTYGDPATPIPRGYVGDPTKFRLVNAGPGQPHVHHLHGGGDRWRVSPVSEADTQFDAGRLKTNPIIKSNSERVDVQLISPGETFNAEIEGGAGGVQQSVGDFLFHCHIAEHYVAGMFSFWRVYNTQQPDLMPLPDRVALPSPVNSLGLLGKQMPDGTILDATNLPGWIEPSLPPQGSPADDESAVWNWTVTTTVSGPLYLGEPETTKVWPNYRSETPGERPEILFSPLNGRPSFPLLRPHFGERPPFAPGNGPAPYLTPNVDAAHPDGLCPAGSTDAGRHREYKVVAFGTTVAYNPDQADPGGQIFAHASDVGAIRSGQKEARNLILRANQGDCVDVTLTSALDDTAENDGHSKVNMHIHLVQFDVQGSDGVISGLNFETSVRPAHATGTALAADTVAGATSIRVGSTDVIKVGTFIGIGLTTDQIEIRRVTDKNTTHLMFAQPLEEVHVTGERVGNEFVRYRWYPDVDLGMVYWHDHVDGLNSWRHGLFGGIVVEPAGSEWRDPKNYSAPQVLEGPVVDIVGPNGTYREVVLEFQEKSAVKVPDVVGGPTDCRVVEDVCDASFNLRSAPLAARTLGGHPLSSAGNGDPNTTMLHAYPGDPIVIRLLFGGQSNSRAVATFGLTGHRFQFERNNPGSRLVDAVSFGISSQHNFGVECGAGGCGRFPGDYLYYITQPQALHNGAWGIFRVHDTEQNDLEHLPGYASLSYNTTLPSGKPVRYYDVVSMNLPVTTPVFLNDHPLRSVTANLKFFALASEETAIRNGLLRPTPLVLRALPGEIVQVNLTNKFTGSFAAHKVGMHPSLLWAEPGDGLGIPVGNNAEDLVANQQTRSYRWYADKEVGVTHLTSFARETDGVSGLYAALVVEPATSTFTPATGTKSTLNVGGSSIREHVLMFGTNDPRFMEGIMPYNVDVTGIPAANVNYRSESLFFRSRTTSGVVPAPSPVGPQSQASSLHVGGLGVHVCQLDAEECLTRLPTIGETACDPFGAEICVTVPPVLEELKPGLPVAHPGVFEARNPTNFLLRRNDLYGDPQTPILDVARDQGLVLRVLGASGDQTQAFTVAGHWWNIDPNMTGSNLVDTQTLGTREVLNAWIPAAGPGGAGDYYWGNHREAFAEAGMWGVLRVT